MADPDKFRNMHNEFRVSDRALVPAFHRNTLRTIRLLPLLLIISTYFYVLPAIPGEIFFWTDEDGIRHYSNVLPSQSVTDILIYEEKSTEEKSHEEKNHDDKSTQEKLYNDKAGDEESGTGELMDYPFNGDSSTTDAHDRRGKKEKKSRKKKDNSAPKSSDNYSERSGRNVKNRSNTHAVLSSDSFKVLKVYDGDTIKVSGKELTFVVRLVGIDAPESGGYYRRSSSGTSTIRNGSARNGSTRNKSDRNGSVRSKFNSNSSTLNSSDRRNETEEGQPFSRESKEALSSLVSRNGIKIKSYGTDTYNRILAEVFTSDNRLVNIELLKSGMAEIYRGSSTKGIDMESYRNAEKEAKERHLGIWSLGQEYQSPRSWRKKHPWKKK